MPQPPSAEAKAQHSTLKLSDTVFNSCAGLAALMQPVSPAMAVLQLSCGPPTGRLRVYGLGAFRVSVLETAPRLFLSGQRRSDRFTLAVELGQGCDLNDLRAQGTAMPWPGFVGFNRALKDFDLRLPASSQFVTLLIPTTLEQGDSRLAPGTLTRQRLEQCNLLELKTQQQQQLAGLVERLTSDRKDPQLEKLADHFLEVTLAAFEAPAAQTDFIKPRQERHQAALKVLHRYMANPKDLVNSEALSEELAVSRSVLFKGCREHFALTPTQLQRSIRLDRVRRELLQGSKHIGSVAADYGFKSRSHFAGRYRDQFGESPQNTLEAATERATS